MRKRRGATPLLTKITAMFMILILAACVLATFFCYTIETNKQMSEAAAQNMMLLNSMSASVATRAAQIEIILQELANEGSVTRLLRAPTREKQIVLLEFSVKPEMLDSRAYLMDASAEVMVLSHVENMVTTSDYIISDACMADNETYQAFLRGVGYDAWHCGESPLPGSASKEKQAVYLYKIMSGVRDCGGVLRCSVPQSVMFGSLENWAGDGTLYVMENGEPVYRYGDGDHHLPVGRGGASWREGDTLYVTTGIGGMDLNLILAMDYGAVLSAVEGNVRQSLIMITLFGISLFLGTRLMLIRLLSKLQSLTKAVRNMPAQNYDVLLPESGPDEVGQLSMAFSHLLMQINEAYDQLLQKEKDKRRAMMMALQYQINPHFLFNSLYCLQLKAESLGMSPELCDSIAQLGVILHYSLDDSPVARVWEEERHMQAYISFMRTAKDCPVTLELTMPGEMRDWRILRFTLQPILENSIRHGWVRGRDLRLSAAFSADARFLRILVENDGRQIPPERLDEIRRRMAGAKDEIWQAAAHGVGLVNLVRRLELHYGVSARLSVTSDPGATRFEIVLPREPCERGEDAGA